MTPESARCSRLRDRLRVDLGDGGRPELQCAIRAHGNAVEWTLPMLVLFVIAEIDGANRIFLHACGIVFVVSRIAHAAGISRSSAVTRGRFWGTAGSTLVTFALALWDFAAFARMMPGL